MGPKVTTNLVVLRQYPSYHVDEEVFHQFVPTIKTHLECMVVLEVDQNQAVSIVQCQDKLKLFCIKLTVSTLNKTQIFCFIASKTFLQAFRENLLIASVSPLLILYRRLCLWPTLGHKQVCF